MKSNKSALAKICGYLFDKNERFRMNAVRGKYPQIPDEDYLRRLYAIYMGKPLNLENPVTFNEKLQWLKLHDRKPIYTTMVDKAAAKEYVAEKIGAEHIIPTLGVWDRFDDIDFDSLPDRFVLKTTHDSGGVVICRDQKTFNKKAARKKLEKSLKRDYYAAYREQPYQNVPRRILAEQYMGSDSGELVDYKFFCFGGHADCVMICLDRHLQTPKFYFFDQNWDLKRLNIRGKNAPEGFTVPKPENMDEMFRIAERLSRDMPFLRVDLYNVGGRIYFGELTFFPDSGFDANLLPETDRYFGALLKLPLAEGTEK